MEYMLPQVLRAPASETRTRNLGIHKRRITFLSTSSMTTACPAPWFRVASDDPCARTRRMHPKTKTRTGLGSNTVMCSVLFPFYSCVHVRPCAPACLARSEKHCGTAQISVSSISMSGKGNREESCRRRLRVYVEMMRVAPKFYPIQSSERAVTRIGNIGRLAQDTCTSSLALENPIFPRRFSISTRT